MLVALTISEDTIYPLIQSCVWAKIGGEPRLLKRVLDSFIRVSGEGRREKGGGDRWEGGREQGKAVCAYMCQDLNGIKGTTKYVCTSMHMIVHVNVPAADGHIRWSGQS